MSENERLRKILGLVRYDAEEALKVNPHHDVLCYRQEHSVTSGDCDCWRKYCHMAIDTINKALTAKPEVCVWTHHPNYTYTRSCDGRKTQFIPGSYMNGADFETDTICSGCGREIEVRS